MRLFDTPPAPICPKCGAMTWLARRVPQPEFGVAHERQTFECPKCDGRLVRDVGPTGATEMHPVPPDGDDEIQKLAERMTGIGPRCVGNSSKDLCRETDKTPSRTGR